jgi:hypothetical protein
MSPAIVAVHSAGRLTGIVRRAGNDLTGWDLFTHSSLGLVEHATAVLDRTATLVKPGDRVALVTLPDPADLLGHGAGSGVIRRAVLLGTLLTDPLACQAPLLVHQANYGSWLLDGYPPELVGPRERSGAGRLRACRAAWDLAGAAMPDGPPTSAADQARLGELATVTEDPASHWPGWRTMLRTCHACNQTSRYQVPADSPTTTGDEHARFTREHVALHLQASGRAGSLLVADTAQLG